MTLLALGINHKTAPVALREKVSFSPDTMGDALNNLLQQPAVRGGVVLSTCMIGKFNRLFNEISLYLRVYDTLFCNKERM